jgi:hypothetical protein
VPHFILESQRQEERRRAQDIAGDQQPPPLDEARRGTPIGLTREQLGGASITRAGQGIPVTAWVPWTGTGAYHEVRAWAGEWTHNAVRIRWQDLDGRFDLWVRADDVRRRTERRFVGLPATMRSDTRAFPDGHPHRPGPE